MLEHPGQRLKLPDGPSVQPRQILEGISKFVNVNVSRFFRGC